MNFGPEPHQLRADEFGGGLAARRSRRHETITGVGATSEWPRHAQAISGATWPMDEPLPNGGNGGEGKMG